MSDDHTGNSIYDVIMYKEDHLENLNEIERSESKNVDIVKPADIECECGSTLGNISEKDTIICVCCGKCHGNNSSS